MRNMKNDYAFEKALLKLKEALPLQVRRATFMKNFKKGIKLNINLQNDDMLHLLFYELSEEINIKYDMKLDYGPTSPYYLLCRNSYSKNIFGIKYSIINKNLSESFFRFEKVAFELYKLNKEDVLSHVKLAPDYHRFTITFNLLLELLIKTRESLKEYLINSIINDIIKLNQIGLLTEDQKLNAIKIRHRFDDVFVDHEETITTEENATGMSGSDGCPPTISTTIEKWTWTPANLDF